MIGLPWGKETKKRWNGTKKGQSGKEGEKTKKSKGIVKVEENKEKIKFVGDNMDEA
jgi:hypothetical protein